MTLPCTRCSCLGVRIQLDPRDPHRRQTHMSMCPASKYICIHKHETPKHTGTHSIYILHGKTHQTPSHNTHASHKTQTHTDTITTGENTAQQTHTRNHKHTGHAWEHTIQVNTRHTHSDGRKKQHTGYNRIPFSPNLARVSAYTVRSHNVNPHYFTHQCPHPR